MGFAVSRYLLEFPAGTLETGETPINSIKREIQEEAGYKAEEWDKLGTLVNAPGYSDEVIHLFLARKLHKLDNDVQGDLVKDNKALMRAFALSKAITSIYIFDETYPYDFNSKSRSWFLGESLKELNQNWEKAGSRL